MSASGKWFGCRAGMPARRRDSMGLARPSLRDLYPAPLYPVPQARDRAIFSDVPTGRAGANPFHACSSWCGGAAFECQVTGNIMLAQIKHFFERRRQQKAVVAVACDWLERTRRRDVLGGRILHSDQFGFIVRIVCNTPTRPSGRAWLRVSPDMNVIQELSFDEAKQYGEMPWR